VVGYAQSEKIPMNSDTLLSQIPGYKGSITILEYHKAAGTDDESKMIKTQNQLSCLKKQIREIEKVSDMVGSRSEYDSVFEKKKIDTHIGLHTENSDTTQHAEAYYEEGIVISLDLRLRD
jgi:hypothetical protein